MLAHASCCKWSYREKPLCSLYFPFLFMLLCNFRLVHSPFIVCCFISRKDYGGNYGNVVKLVSIVISTLISIWEMLIKSPISYGFPGNGLWIKSAFLQTGSLPTKQKKKHLIIIIMVTTLAGYCLNLQ